MTEPRKTTRSRAASGAAQGEQAASDAAAAAATPPVAAAPPVAPATPIPPTPPVPPTAPPTPPPAMAAVAPTPPPATMPDGPPPGAQISAAISGVATTLKQRLSGPELLLGGGALLIVGASFLLFSFLLGTRGPSEASVVVAGLLLGFIGLQRTQTEGFGSWYKVILVLLGAILAMGAAYSLLYELRHSASVLSGLDWLSMLCWWAGGVLAGVGSWLSYKVRLTD